jgi:membrane protease YdiL (CAAX protease family)
VDEGAQDTRVLLTFFSVTYVVSWSLFIAAAALSGGAASPPAGLAAVSGLVLFLGVLVPSLVALALTARREGRAGTLALLRQIVPRPVGVQWYVFAASYTAAIKLTAAALHRLVTGAWPPFGQTPVYIMVGAVLISTPVQAGEEIGWRGYALPRLAARLGLARASIVLGVLWACWHLPFFFMPSSDTFNQSFPVYLLQVTALSVAMAWLYWRTQGSLLLVMLLHAAVNNTKDIVPSTVAGATNPWALSTSLIAWLTVALLWICAIYFLVQMGPAELELGLTPAGPVPGKPAG